MPDIKQERENIYQAEAATSWKIVTKFNSQLNYPSPDGTNIAIRNNLPLYLPTAYP